VKETSSEKRKEVSSYSIDGLLGRVKTAPAPNETFLQELLRWKIAVDFSKVTKCGGKLEFQSERRQANKARNL
jgi:hypothetical protein